MSDRDWFGTTEETQQNKEAEGVAEELSAANKDGEQKAEAAGAEAPQNTSDIRQEGSTPNPVSYTHLDVYKRQSKD